MIKILIVEDEIPARKKLKRFLAELDTEFEVVAEIDSVSMGISFLKSSSVDLIFSDIELLDGNAFEIYSQVSLSCPIIFTTAYDQFWMNAFDSNGIAYLLKPFSKERFQKAWDKFLIFGNAPSDANKLLSSLTKIIEQNFAKQRSKMRFAVHDRKSIYFLDTESISFFEAGEGVVFAYDTTFKKHLLTESTLKEIEEQLNSAEFFRLNRKELIHKLHIEKIEYNTKNTLAIKLRGCQKYLLTSQNKTAPFRIWIKQ